MILELASFGLLIISIIGLFQAVWWFTIMDFFRLQYSVLAIILLIISIFSLNFISIGLNTFTVAVNLYRIRKFLPHLPTSSTCENKNVVAVNAYESNDSVKKLKLMIEKANPTILLIMEMTDETKQVLEPTLKKYPYNLTTPVRDGFRICLLSKNELKNTDITYHGGKNTPFLQAQTEIEDRTWQIFSAHPRPSFNKKWHEERRTYFQETEQIIKKSEGPILMLGDFNSVPWGKQFTDFLSTTNLQSTLQGRGHKITWPAYFPPIGIPMDHILITKGQDYKDLHIGSSVGSDHYPVLINV